MNRSMFLFATTTGIVLGCGRMADNSDAGDASPDTQSDACDFQLAPPNALLCPTSYTCRQGGPRTTTVACCAQSVTSPDCYACDCAATCCPKGLWCTGWDAAPKVCP